MELETFFTGAISAILAIFLAGALFIWYSANPPLPGPSLLDYLPGGLTYQLFRDSRSSTSVMLELQKRHGDKFHLWLGPVRVAITAVPEDVAQIISSADCFFRPPPVRSIFSVVAPRALMDSVGATHAAHRRNMRKRFNHSMLESFQQKMSQAVQELCSNVEEHVDKGPVELRDYIGVATFRIITDVALGSSLDTEEQIKFNTILEDLAGEMLKEVVGYPIRQALAPFGTRNKFLAHVKSLQRIFQVFVQKRLSETRDEKASRAPDMLDTYLETCDGDIELAYSLSLEAAIAGNLTTNQTITWALYELCCNPRVRKKVDEELDKVCNNKALSEWLTSQEVRDLKYLHQVWKEVLRRRPLSCAMMRKATREVVLEGSGLRIPKGGVVSAFFAAGHLSPKVWTNPLEFRPERWGEERGSEGQRASRGTYIPFGAGGYSCVGKFLADYEGPLILAELCRRFSFQLGCKPDDIKTCSLFVDSAKYVVGNEERGVPFLVSRRVR